MYSKVVLTSSKHEKETNHSLNSDELLDVNEEKKNFDQKIFDDLNLSSKKKNKYHR